MEQQIFVGGFIGFFSVLLITAPIYRAYLTEKKENDSRKEQERFERYRRKQDKILKSAVFMGFDVGHPHGDNKTQEDEVSAEIENNIDISNDIANILRERGITLDYKFFNEPSNGPRLEHIFALVREMLRTY